jgi:hypothetical protein
MKASWEALPGLSSQAAVRACTALRGRFGVLWNCSSGFKREHTLAPVLPEWAETLLRLAKGEKRSRIQQPSTTACIFLLVQVIQG